MTTTSPADHAAAAGPSRLRKQNSSAADAFSGDPTRAATASAIAGCVQAMLLLPVNTVQTQMQTRGLGALTTLAGNFSGGGLAGIRALYRAILPTIGMLGARQGLKFGTGSQIKQRLPWHWPEMLKDAIAGASSACLSTTLLFPLDTVKTRYQMNMSTPNIVEMYRGFQPAVLYSAFGMGLWVVSRNGLERTLTTERTGLEGHSKHLITGGLAGVLVQVPTFPFDTLKKRLQASESPTGSTVMREARTLISEGGFFRLYRGFPVKCTFVAANGAIFNAVYVWTRKLLRMHSDQQR